MGQSDTFKFATIKAEAKRKAETRGIKAPKVKPFVIEDVEPNIVITVPDTKRMLVISECIGPDGIFQMANVMPLLRALCGDQFGRVWQLIPSDDDSAQDILLGVIQKLWEHFDDAIREVMEVEENPGGSEGSSDS